MDPDFDGRPAGDPGADHRRPGEARSARIDFTGTTAELATNYNAPEPVTRAAVLYVFRCLVDDDIPMNEGVMKPLRGGAAGGDDAVAALSGGGDRGQRRDEPGGDLGAVPRARGAGGGAVDDEQHHLGRRPAAVLRDGLRRDRGRACCRTGAGYAGTSGVHSHMTNSRLTDPEVLEWRYPVVLGRVPAAARVGRRGAVPRRRRGGAADPLPRADDGGDPGRAPGGAAAGAGRRRAGGGAGGRGSCGRTGRSRSWRRRTGARSGRGTSGGWRRRGAAAIGVGAGHRWIRWASGALSGRMGPRGP